MKQLIDDSSSWLKALTLRNDRDKVRVGDHRVDEEDGGDIRDRLELSEEACRRSADAVRHEDELAVTEAEHAEQLL